MTRRIASPKSALVLGGASDIALAAVRRLVDGGLVRVVLAVREPATVAGQLTAEPLGPDHVTIEQWDALDTSSHAAMVQRAAAELGHIDLVLCAVGSLGHGAGVSAEPAAARALFDANFTGPASALTAAAHHLVAQGDGTIVVLSSVAGLRARKSNYLYGAAKAGLDVFTQGLADAVATQGIRVHLIRPGFVASKMTAGLDPAPFATTTAAVAAAIASAVTAPRSQIVHVPSLLGPMFAVLRAAPRPLWRRIAGDR